MPTVTLIMAIETIDYTWFYTSSNIGVKIAIYLQEWKPAKSTIYGKWLIQIIMYSDLELPSFSWLMPQTSVIVFPLNQGHRPTQLDFLAIVNLNWEPSNKNKNKHPHQKTYWCHQCAHLQTHAQKMLRKWFKIQFSFMFSVCWIFIFKLMLRKWFKIQFSFMFSVIISTSTMITRDSAVYILWRSDALFDGHRRQNMITRYDKWEQ